MNVTYGVDPETDSNRHNPEPHWRLYHSKNGGPTVVEVQDFDYPDYEAERFMTAKGYTAEDDARFALGTYLFRARALHEATADERLSRALTAIDLIATALSEWRDRTPDDEIPPIVGDTLRELRTLQRDLIR
jgi:hypothetical protein